MRSAEGGTLLLDEIGDLPLPAQPALLRVLQEQEVVPVGTARPLKVDVRFLAATHRDLDQLVAEARFRTDLLARISGHVCALPALRERREDLSLLISDVLSRTGNTGHTLTIEAARALLRYAWPLNVRELELCLASAALLARGGQVELEHLPQPMRTAQQPAAGAAPAPLTEDRRRRDELIFLLQEHRGNVTAAARAIGKARSQVQRWLRRFRVDPRSFRR